MNLYQMKKWGNRIMWTGLTGIVLSAGGSIYDAESCKSLDEPLPYAGLKISLLTASGIAYLSGLSLYSIGIKKELNAIRDRKIK